MITAKKPTVTGILRNYNIPAVINNLEEDRDSPHMQDMAMTLLETGGWEISSKGDHHTKAGVATAIGGWDGQMSTTQRSRR